MIRILDPKYLQRAAQLAASPYRPREIVELKEEIDGETRALELVSGVTGKADPDAISRIVEMRLRLDSLYMDWAEGKIE